MCRRLGDQHAAVPAATRDDPPRTAMPELEALADCRAGVKDQHLGLGARIGDDNRLAAVADRGPLGRLLRRSSCSGRES